jgi:hypothetical protein
MGMGTRKMGEVDRAVKRRADRAGSTRRARGCYNMGA